ncbi:MAG: hypothetical protein M3O71_22865 [Bacteroidota bacterium]|nr:hypothetical protein [Bacteroidota bacterium]
MTNFYLDTINVICASSLIALSFVDNITKKSFEKKSKVARDTLANFKKIWVKVIIVSTLGITAIWVNYEKNQNVMDDTIAAAKKFKSQLDQRDRENQKNFNKSLSQSSASASKANAETMAKYYLKYDSVQRKIEKIVSDSSGYKLEKPELALSSIEGVEKNDTIAITSELRATQGTAYNVQFSHLYVIRMYNFTFDDKYLRIVKNEPITSHKSLSPNGISYSITNNIKNNDFRVNKPRIYVFIKGIYKDIKGKIYKFENLSYYDFSTQSEGEPSNKEYLWIRHFIMQN